MSRTVPFPLPRMGIDNVSHETQLKAGWVRNAVNVDISASGAFRRRRGYRLLAAGDFHSLWRNPVTGMVMACRGDEVCIIGAAGKVFPVARLPSADPISFCEHNGTTYWAHAKGCGRIRPGEAIGRAVGVPSTWYEVLRESPGNLPPGRYGVSTTAVDEFGEESAASPVEIIEVKAGGITVAGLQADAPIVRVYITDANGEVLRMAIEAPAGLPVYTVADPASGGELDTRQLAPLPGGQLITGHAGRVFVARGSSLCFSNAMRPHLWEPAHGYVEFTGRISMLASVADGVYVGDDRGVWFLSGLDAEKFTMRRVSVVPAMDRSMVVVEATAFDEKVVPSRLPVVVWATVEGFKVGQAGGDVVDLNASQVRLARGAGKSAYVMQDGVKQVISLLKSGLSAVGSAEDSQTLFKE